MAVSYSGVYLAGPVDYTDDPESWRERAKDMFYGIDVIDPLCFNDDYGSYGDEVVYTCLRRAKQCQYMLLNWDMETMTVGTFIEMGFAIHNNTSIVWYNPNGPISDDDSPSQFLKTLTMYSDYSLEGCVDFIQGCHGGI